LFVLYFWGVVTSFLIISSPKNPLKNSPYAKFIQNYVSMNSSLSITLHVF